MQTGFNEYLTLYRKTIIREYIIADQYFTIMDHKNVSKTFKASSYKSS